MKSDQKKVRKKEEFSPDEEKEGIKKYSPDKKEVIKSDIKRGILVVIFTFIYGLGFTLFIQASSVRLYGGGVAGIAQLVLDFITVVSNKTINVQLESILLFAMILGINIPLFIFAWFKVSKRFATFSAISVIIQSTVIGFIPSTPFQGQDPLLLSVIGGMLIGVGVGGALRFGTSTGGFDIIAQYVALNKGRSVAQISTSINVIVAILGSIILSFGPGTEMLVAGQSEAQIISGIKLGGLIASYTIIRLIITMLVTDKIHTIYNYIEYNIITDKGEELSQAIIEHVHRGVTIMDVRGGYGFNEKNMLYLIVMSFERHKLDRVIKQVDPDAFLVSKPVKSIGGNFSKKRVV